MMVCKLNLLPHRKKLLRNIRTYVKSVSALLDQKPDRELMRQFREQEQALLLGTLSCGPNSGTDPGGIVDPNLLPNRKCLHRNVRRHNLGRRIN